MNPQTRATRTLPHPIYTVAPDGTWGLSLDFARLNVFRPGYGYAGVACRNLAAKAPDDTGIWRVDLKTGAATLLVSLARLAALPHRGQPTSGYWNWVNHLLVDPSGRRFVFLHRWREQYDTAARTGTNFVTRMFSADTADGGNLFMLDPSGHTSHFIWRDPERLCMWTRPLGRAKDGFFLFRDRTAEVHPVGEGKMPTNGHNTYVPGTNQEWILNDTYPAGRERLQSVYLFHVPSGRRVDLGRFHSPAAYAGEWRCDTHPRCSRDGKLAALDSPHGGAGRQVHLLDLSKLVG